MFAIVEPDVSAWDAFVAGHPRGHLLQSSGWGALKSKNGWHTQRLTVVGEDGSGTLRVFAGAQVLIRRRAGLSAVYVPRGPLLSGSAEIDRPLLQAIDRVARRARAVFLRLEPNVLETDAGADELHSQLLLVGFEPADPLQPRSSIHLDLAPEPERLLAGMSKGHRADVRRATRSGVTVRAGAGTPDLNVFYAILAATGARAQFGIHHRDYYQAVDHLFGAAARLWLAERDGVTQAVALTVAWGGAGLYLYSGSTDAGLKSGAQHLIQWQAIQWVRERGCAIYDFWGVPDLFGLAASVADPAERERLEMIARADPLFGVYRFKKGFGGRVVRYLPAYDRVYLRPLYALWQRRTGG